MNESDYERSREELEQTFVALAEIRKLTCEKLILELKSGKISAYNAANAYSSLTTAISRMVSIIRETPPAPIENVKETAEAKTIRKISSKMLSLMARSNAEQQQPEDSTDIVA
jgi:hypothetical protein